MISISGAPGALPAAMLELWCTGLCLHQTTQNGYRWNSRPHRTHLMLPACRRLLTLCMLSSSVSCRQLDLMLACSISRMRLGACVDLPDMLPEANLMPPARSAQCLESSCSCSLCTAAYFMRCTGLMQTVL